MVKGNISLKQHKIPYPGKILFIKTMEPNAFFNQYNI